MLTERLNHSKHRKKIKFTTLAYIYSNLLRVKTLSVSPCSLLNMCFINQKRSQVQRCKGGTLFLVPLRKFYQGLISHESAEK